MRVELLGYLAIALICTIVCVLLIYHGCRNYNHREVLNRTTAKNLIVTGVIGLLIIIIALIDVWHQ